MPCVRGCCETQAEHYQSLRVADPDRAAMKKVTTEKDSTVEVAVTEHWHDRQDVLVKPGPISIKAEELRNG
jgi:hypothetical protein